MGRRRETTEYLKECIADAMIKLMKKQPLEKITVQEITDAAGVGRVTYFRYFTSKTDVLVYKLTMLWQNWTKKHPFPKEKGEYDQALWFFSFCYSIRAMLKLLFKDEQQNALLLTYLAITAPILGENEKGHEGRYLRAYMSYGMLGVVTEWANDNFRERPEILAEYCTQ